MEAMSKDEFELEEGMEMAREINYTGNLGEEAREGV